MPRRHRIHFPKAMYHVIMRGNNKKDIFFSNKHRAKFCLFLQEGIEKFLCKCHTYCLMSNHIHLIMEVNDVPLSVIMHSISGRYARWLNFHLERTGHLFQGRYKSILIKDERYMLDLCRYIHLNPVRADIVNLPEQYFWSGHRTYLGLEQTSWLSTDFILSLLNRMKESYRQFIQGENPDFIPILTIGEEGNLVSRDCMVGSNSVNLKQYNKELFIEFLIDTVCRELSVDKRELSLPGSQRQLAKARTIIALYIQKYGLVSLRKQASIFHRSIQRLSYAVNRLRTQQIKHPDKNPELIRIDQKLRLKMGRKLNSIDNTGGTA